MFFLEGHSLLHTVLIKTFCDKATDTVSFNKKNWLKEDPYNTQRMRELYFVYWIFLWFNHKIFLGVLLRVLAKTEPSFGKICTVLT